MESGNHRLNLPTEPEYLALINTLLQIIDHLPVSDNDKFASTACLLNYVISFELDKYEINRVNIAMEEEAKEGAQEEFKQSIENLSGEGTNVILRMHQNDIFKELGSDPMYRTGLQIIIRGIEQLAFDQRS